MGSHQLSSWGLMLPLCKTGLGEQERVKKVSGGREKMNKEKERNLRSRKGREREKENAREEKEREKENSQKTLAGNEHVGWIT